MSIELKATGERLTTDMGDKIMVEHLHRYSLALQYTEDKIVLDIASGEGYGSNLLAQKAKHVYGVDISEEAISFAGTKYKRNNLQFIKGAADNIPLPDKSIDVIVSFETIEHHDQHDKMMEQCRRVLKDDGLLIISSPDKEFYADIPNYKNPFHVKELYTQEFLGLVTKYFSNAILYKQGIVYGSIIYPVAAMAFKDLQVYEGEFTKINRSKNIKRPEYNLILASNTTFENPTFSLFEDDSLNGETKYQELKNSKTFRLGKFVAAPFRFFKKIFRK